MIFYFSGTGNSLWVAKRLSDTFCERLVDIAGELKKKTTGSVYDLRADEKVFLVFPVHSWGPAVPVRRFLKNIRFAGYNGQDVFVICVCGDNCGNTDKIIGRQLKKKGIEVTRTYSIQMPNNYILMKGFGTDPKEVEEQKLRDAPGLLDEITEQIHHQKPVKYIRGSKPLLKSGIVYPFFRTFAIGSNSFYAKENCTSCGLCARICPTDTITLQDGRPVWGNTCVQCTACIHRCPVNAIEYGKISEGQGRYHHPDLK